MIVILKTPATDKDIKNASADYPNYVKITIDIEKEIVIIGGEYHFDAEQFLLNQGSGQKNIWGGGLDLITKEMNTIAMLNVRPKINPHQDIQNISIKKNFIKIAYKYLHKYAKKPEILS